MELMIVIVVIIIVFLVILTLLGDDKKQKPKSPRTPITSKNLMTNHELLMFELLKQTVPECHIFSQVALGAILKTRGQGTRNKFSQKIADFVITDQDFVILAVIELDDRSHIGKELKDAERDAMVREAGYKALRYPSIPSISQLRSDILSQS